MATLARCQLVITDEAGNVVDGASVEVRLESTSALVAVYSDRAGTASLGNPFTAADGADAGFHVAGGAYKITATLGAFTRVWRYVAIGTAAESDSGGLPTPYTIGDLLYASSTSVLSKLAAVAIGSILVSQGVGVAPVWSSSPTLSGRLTQTTTPTFDLAAGVLGVAYIVPLNSATQAVAASKAFNFIRLTRTDGSVVSFTADDSAQVAGLYSELTLAAGSHVNASGYGSISHVNVAGPSTGKGIHAAAFGLGTSTGVLVAVNAQVQPVATSSVGSAAVQLALSSSGINDIATGVNFTSTSGDRWNLGIGSSVAPVSINAAFYDAWMATGCAATARASRVRNNAGTELAYQHKDGTIAAPLGAVGTPSYTFKGDENTGIFSSAADTLSFVTAGALRAQISSGGLVGIGTVAPDAIFSVNANTVAGGDAIFGVLVHFVGADATNPLIQFDAFGGAPQMIFRRANGTAGTKTAVLANDGLANYAGRGYDGSAYTSTAKAIINLTASENWSTTALGTHISFFTTKNTTTTRSETWRMDNAGALLGFLPGGGVGYGTGAGGAVTQLTSKATAVTLDKVTGAITTHNATLNAATIVSFVLNNSAIAATDQIVCMHESGGTTGAYTINARATGAGTAAIDIRNNTAGNLGEAIVIRFAVIKSVNA